jgi:hypothetical protein
MAGLAGNFNGGEKFATIEITEASTERKLEARHLSMVRNRLINSTVDSYWWNDRDRVILEFRDYDV